MSPKDFCKPVKICALAVSFTPFCQITKVQALKIKKTKVEALSKVILNCSFFAAKKFENDYK
jgi:hypothetical protein